jgi:hypothetical protein
MNDTKLIKELLGDEFAQKILAEIGIEGDPPEIQAQFISEIGEAILQRMVLEILKRLPKAEATQFEELIGGGDMEAIRSLVSPHIPQFDQFIADTAQKEYLLIKTKLQAVH